MNVSFKGTANAAVTIKSTINETTGEHITTRRLGFRVTDQGGADYFKLREAGVYEEFPSATQASRIQLDLVETSATKKHGPISQLFINGKKFVPSRRDSNKLEQIVILIDKSIVNAKEKFLVSQGYMDSTRCREHLFGGFNQVGAPPKAASTALAQHFDSDAVKVLSGVMNEKLKEMVTLAKSVIYHPKLV